MSSNNYLHIKETPNGNFSLTERDADTKEFLSGGGIFPSLREALDIANKWLRKENVEYGLDIDLIQK